MSVAVIDAGQFEKGIFTTPEMAESMRIQSLDDLRQYRALMVGAWQVDKQTLLDMGLKDVILATKPTSLVPMLTAKRADFTILEFDSLKNVAWSKGVVMLEGVKVGLNATRSFPMSPTRPKLVQAINAYLTKIKTETPHLLKRAFESSGFIKTEYADWKLLFP